MLFFDYINKWDQDKILIPLRTQQMRKHLLCTDQNDLKPKEVIMAGRIISTSPLATQTNIYKFYQAKASNCHVNLKANSRDSMTLFCAKNRWVFAIFPSIGDTRFVTS